MLTSLDLSALERAYAGRGVETFHPASLLALLVYGYATGTCSSRKIKRATYDSLAFCFIAGNAHPDHHTLANFRKRFGAQFPGAFVQLLQVARANQLSRASARSAWTGPRSTPRPPGTAPCSTSTRRRSRGS